MNVRLIQNYRYPRKEVDAVVSALNTNIFLPLLLEPKFRFFALTEGGDALEYEGRVLVLEDRITQLPLGMPTRMLGSIAACVPDGKVRRSQAE